MAGISDIIRDSFSEVFPIFRDEFRKKCRKSMEMIYKISNILFNFYLGLFIVFVIFYIFLPIVSPPPNYDEIIKNGERITTFLISMAGLTYTYAAVLKDGSDKRNIIVKNGNYFFISVLCFVVGMIFSILYVRQILTNPAPMNDFNPFLIILPLLIGFSIILFSGYFFVKGVIGLLKSFLIEN